MGLGVERIRETVANLRLQLAVISLVELRSGEGALGLAVELDQFVNGGNDLLDLAVGELDGGEG